MISTIACLLISTQGTLPSHLDSFTLNINGVQREFLAYFPKTKDMKPRPVVFGWHGHGGTGKSAAKKYLVHEYWPQAIAIYPTGLPSKGKTDPEGVRNGWQKSVGENGDRDLKFFDALVAWVKAKAPIDTNRIYSMGHSNGGGFTYLLWAHYPGLFAAIAPSAAGAAGTRGGDFKPIPLIQVAGRQDETVPYESQMRTIQRIRQLNKCETTAKKFDSKLPTAEKAEMWSSSLDCPVVLYSYDGGHKMPDEANPIIVDFLRRFSKH